MKVVSSLAIAVVIAAILVPCGGCRICAECNDLDYPAYGGLWQRTRRDSGRVGSVFDPAGAKVSELSAAESDRSPEAALVDPDAAQSAPSSHSDVETENDSATGPEPTGPEPTSPEPTSNGDPVDSDQGSSDEEASPRSAASAGNQDPDDIQVRIVPGEPLPPVQF